MENIFGDRLKELREEHEFTQQQLALMLKVSREHISSWERNMVKPDIETIISLATLFSVTTDYLLGLSNTQYNQQNTNENIGHKIYGNNNYVKGNINIKN